jgi:hypothetical protein
LLKHRGEIKVNMAVKITTRYVARSKEMSQMTRNFAAASARSTSKKQKNSLKF